MPESILIIDDHQSWLSVLNSILVQSGFQVLLASSAEKGISMAVEHQPSIILLDVMMPKMNGLEVLGLLRRNAALAETPIIMISAQADAKTQADALVAGADSYMIKPVHPTELIKRIQSLIRNANGSAEAPS
jgi:DNA-binding response OmpR family regulator